MKFYFFLVRTEQLKVVWKAVFYLQALRPPVRLKLVRKKKSRRPQRLSEDTLLLLTSTFRENIHFLLFRHKDIQAFLRDTPLTRK